MLRAVIGDMALFEATALPTFSVEVNLASRFHCMLLAPGLIGSWALYTFGVPRGKGTLPNLEAAKGPPLTTRGQVMTDVASGGAEPFFTTCIKE